MRAPEPVRSPFVVEIRGEPDADALPDDDEHGDTLRELLPHVLIDADDECDGSAGVAETVAVSRIVIVAVAHALDE